MWSALTCSFHALVLPGGRHLMLITLGWQQMLQIEKDESAAKDTLLIEEGGRGATTQEAHLPIVYNWLHRKKRHFRELGVPSPEKCCPAQSTREEGATDTGRLMMPVELGTWQAGAGACKGEHKEDHVPATQERGTTLEFVGVRKRGVGSEESQESAGIIGGSSSEDESAYF
ncbi:hypothetical protein BDK51DRAFT_31219 [Blyttiomyces helicus]|uniref:Uncharacterized protein n=1 Tax=Blyttiomyces helicus TaxID=388810 RepID=A0A4P9VXI8_9FUNG|nr:hypothetical protein BDK51DRAFT_31219 [Blyttiomyces helicus]|eukprot:RKO84451.1 hypothetical protein BDK51DRAFT_31219 [Blyttiomyces helicus]